jgi:hypothetical protein
MILVVKRLNVTGMAIWPFILIRNEHLRNNKRLINHELIHHKQQVELLLLPFYILYLLNYLVNLVIFKSHSKAYENIVFEKEAYANEQNLNYLKERRIFNWVKYFNKGVN